ncbi:hypothetical protein IFM89_039233 [Coptis chinensis]|uniref:Protein kinase domain-containing protein n=1 Tax=Coptis chinensis TaxID=261450 RepID=A0A835IHC2_9MAGN|nr:hypothetical protein IFM89_039233 [Coptis chinensis]
MDIPKQLWTKSGIEFVTSILGDPICMDDATSKRERLSYARAYIVVNTDFSFPSSTTMELGKGVNVDIVLEKKQPLKQRWTPKKNTNAQGVTTIDLDPSSSVIPVTDGQTHPEENAEHEEGEIADTQLLPEDKTLICTREINRGDGDCEVTPIVVADSQQHVEVQVEQHEDEPPHQDVALVHMNFEIYSVDLDVVVQVDTTTVHVDAAVGTNDSQNLLISKQSYAPMEQQTRYKAQPISPPCTRSRVQKETRADEEWTMSAAALGLLDAATTALGLQLVLLVQGHLSFSFCHISPSVFDHMYKKSKLYTYNAQQKGSRSATPTEKKMAIVFEEHEYWKRGKMLGKGSYGTVHLAYTNPTKKASRFPPIMAVKSTAYSEASSLMKESDKLIELQGCPYIIGHYGDDDDVENGRAYFNWLSEAEVRYFTPLILKGLKYIHQHEYVHRDIKPDNILLVSSSSDSSLTNVIPKIADFGLAKRLKKEVKKNKPVCITGTPFYMAPESICCNEYKPHSDVWALGIVVLEMLTGQEAWSFDVDDDSVDCLLSRIGFSDELPSIPSKLSTEAKDFVKRCLVKNTAIRWSIDELLNHPFLAVDNKKERIEEKNGGTAERGVVLSPRTPLQPKWWISVSSTDTTYSVAASMEDIQDGKKRKITDDIKQVDHKIEVVNEVRKVEAAVYVGTVLPPRTTLVPNDWWLSFGSNGSIHAIDRPKAATNDMHCEVGKRRKIANDAKEVNFATPSFIPCY